MISATAKAMPQDAPVDPVVLGGVAWVEWDIAVRVTAWVTGHWLVGYFAHNRDPRSWYLEGAGVQGYNVPSCGLITMGEAWHNNHHAFPGSARPGFRQGEIDAILGHRRRTRV